MDAHAQVGDRRRIAADTLVDHSAVHHPGHSIRSMTRSRSAKPAVSSGSGFKAPHWDAERQDGGCIHCVRADGSPVIDKLTGKAKPKCCEQATKVFSREELGLYQEDAFGEPDWFAHWNARDRVEGSFGIFKNLAIVNWGHDYHHFVGLVRETLVATFAVVAHNFHVQRTWRARMALAPTRPRVQRTRTAAIDPTPSVPSTNGTTRKRRGPKGLEFLGTPRAGP
jgi:hypothetical protein